ncbi:MAG: TolC family protein [Pirellulales bacterium]|nr:TolC family protein [Pirellulales bacterium]
MEVLKKTIAIALLGVLSSRLPAQESGKRPGFIMPPDQRTTLPSPNAQAQGGIPEPVPVGKPVVQPVGKFTPEELVALALQRNPSLARSAATVEAARGRWVQVGLPPNPTAGFSGSEMGNNGTAGQVGGYFGQEFVTGGKLRLNRTVIDAEVAEAQRQFEAQRLRVITDTRMACVDVVIAQRRVQIAQELLYIGDRAVYSTDALVRGQQASRYELLQAQVEANSAKIVTQNAHNDLQAAWRRLTAVVGMPELALTPVEADLKAMQQEFTFDGVMQRLLTSSPELAAAGARVVRARQALARASVEKIPNLDVQAGVQHDNSSGYDIANLQAGIPLPILNRNQGGVRAAQGELAAAQSDVSRIQLDLQQRLAIVFQRYANAKHQVETYDKDILPNAKEALDMVQLAIKQGEFDYIVFLTAQRTFFQANLAYLESLRTLRTSEAELEGLLLSGSLERT